tara:strand:+ start:315 stop:503 length:189 start_codon:yes stop_codon:yes gene_type:complete
MHRLEFGIFALGKVIESELGELDLASVAFQLASYSHNYKSDMKEDDLDSEFLIQKLRARASL